MTVSGGDLMLLKHEAGTKSRVQTSLNYVDDEWAAMQRYLYFSIDPNYTMNLLWSTVDW